MKYKVHYVNFIKKRSTKFMFIKRNDNCFCNSGKKWKNCHFPEKRLTNKNCNIIIKNQHQINGIREACKITKLILDEICSHAKEGVSTKYLDEVSRHLHKKYNVIPAPLGYGTPPFPATICTSVNDVACHGIPNEYLLKNGDIVNIDVSCIKNGYYGDCSKMVTIGNIDATTRKLLDVTKESLMASISICKPGEFFKNIGATIESIVNKNGFSVVKDFVGHGVGIRFHEPPQIFHCKNNVPDIMMSGMIFTIEPMVNAGVSEGYFENNEWTYRTLDGKNSAQEEHTILITDDSFEILTI